MPVEVCGLHNKNNVLFLQFWLQVLEGSYIINFQQCLHNWMREDYILLKKISVSNVKLKLNYLLIRLIVNKYLA